MSFFDQKIPTGDAVQSSQYQMKCRWPELVGNHYLQVEQIVQREAPLTKVVSLPDGSMVTADARLDRVRIYYDPVTKLVVRIPIRG